MVKINNNISQHRGVKSIFFGLSLIFLIESISAQAPTDLDIDYYPKAESCASIQDCFNCTLSRLSCDWKVNQDKSFSCKELDGKKESKPVDSS